MIKNIKPNNYILLGIPVLFVIGSLFHFIYSISGNMFIIGLFSPVNESIFEHTKMTILPIFLWWSIFGILRKKDLNINTWFTGAFISLLTTIVSIPMLYYFYTQAFGVETIIVDILILLIAIILGQFLGLHYYRYGKGIKYPLGLTLMLVIITIYVIFTIAPPKIPFFRNPIDGSYGIVTY